MDYPVNTEVKKATLKRIRFQAILPSDFLSPLYVHNGIKYMSMHRHDTHKGEECFSINGDKMYFSGDHSRWLLIRLVQGMIDEMFPKTYELTYIALKENRTTL